MAIARVQGTSGDGGNQSVTTLTLSLTSAPTAGNLLVAFFVIDSDETITGPDGSWQTGPSVYGNNAKIACLYRPDCPTDTDYQFTFGSGVKNAGQMLELSGADTSSPLDGTATNNSTNPVTTGSTGTLSQSGEFGIWAVGVNTSKNGSFGSPTNGYSVDAIGTTSAGASTSKIVLCVFENADVGTASTSSGATYSNTFDQGDGTGNTALATFKPGAAGVNATPSAITPTSSIGSASITAEQSATASPSAATGTSPVPSGTIYISVAPAPAVVAVSVSIPSVSVFTQASADVIASVITVSASSVPNASVTTEGSADATPSVISGTTALPSPDITAEGSADASVTPSSVTGSTAVFDAYPTGHKSVKGKYVGAGGSTAISGTWSGLANAEGSGQGSYASWTAVAA